MSAVKLRGKRLSDVELIEDASGEQYVLVMREGQPTRRILASDLGGGSTTSPIKAILIELSDTTTDLATGGWLKVPLDGAVNGDTANFNVSTVDDDIESVEARSVRLVAALYMTSADARAELKGRVTINGAAQHGFYGGVYIRNTGNSGNEDGMQIVTPFYDLSAGDKLAIEVDDGAGVTTNLLTGGSWVQVEEKGVT